MNMEVVVVAALGRKVGASGINIFMDQQICSNQLSPHFPALQSVDATTSYEPSLFEHFISFILGGNSSKHSFTSVPCRESRNGFFIGGPPTCGVTQKAHVRPTVGQEPYLSSNHRSWFTEDQINHQIN